MSPETLEKINRYSRRPLSEEEVYVFSVILCDNETDRDCERFSDAALEQIARAFVGRTGITDHRPSAANQIARIFDAEVVSEPGRLTKRGAPYKYVRAEAYTVRTDENRALIAEIDAGVKKEVSVSCAASKRICSICGRDIAKSPCEHEKGKYYGGKLCCVILDEVTDAYEWSFVAVPAQRNAGVTKVFSASDADEALRELRREVRRLAFFTGGRTFADAIAVSASVVDAEGLVKLKRSLEKSLSRGEPALQLAPEEEAPSDSADFSI